MPLSPQITITPEDIATKNFDISAVTYTSSTATYTATGHTFSTGDVVLVSGLVPDGYNGTFTITGTATNTFTVANTTNAAVTDAIGNAFWTDSTEFEFQNYDAVYIADSDDLIVINSAIATVENAVNGKNKIYRQSTAPSGSLVTGDIWFDTSNGNRQYYWSGTAWTDVQDTAIAAAAAAASAAQTTADGKNKIYRQGTTPTGTFAIGDTWFNTSSDNAISRWDGSSWVATSLGNGALASISASKITAGTIDASIITVSNLDAGNISTGTLAAARIATGSLDASKITAGTITASQIATGTITATQIAAGTITVDKLVAGTLTGFTVQTSTGNEAVILNGSSNAVQFRSNGSIVANMLPLKIGTSTFGLLMHYGSTPDASGGTRPQIYIGSSNVSLAADTSNLIGISTSGTSVNGSFAVNNTMTYPGITTASGSTMVVVSTGSRVGYTTSSERFKQDITYIQTDGWLDKVLSMRPITYRTSEDFTTEGEPNEVQIGFLAEDINDIGGGLETAVILDPLGDPFSLSYDRLTVFLTLAIKELDARIKALEGK